MSDGQHAMLSTAARLIGALPDRLGFEHFTYAVLLGRSTFTAVGYLDLEEFERRRSVPDMGARRFSVAAAIWGTPSGISLLPSEARSLPAGAVDHRDGSWYRVARPPVLLEALVADTRRPGDGLRSFAEPWWAPVRVIHAERRGTVPIRQRASFQGIGLIEDGDVTVTPRRSRPARPSPVLAWQAELVFDQISDRLPPTA